MYAVIETGGKQYTVKEGDTLYIEKLEVVPEQKITFDKVLLVGTENGVTVGDPYVGTASVDAEVVKNGRAKKIIVFKYNAKKTYRRHKGHRQSYTKVTISAIKA